MVIDFNEVIIFNDEKLFHRKKFSLIAKEAKAIALYFVSKDGIYSPVWGDYVELDSLGENKEKIQELLTKETLIIEDIVELALTLQLISDYYKTNLSELFDALKKDLKNFNIEDLYFSVYV